MDFQKLSAYTRQDATVMCSYIHRYCDIDIVTHYASHHMHKGLKLNAGNYHMRLYGENVCTRWTSKDRNKKVLCNVLSYFEKQAKKRRAPSRRLIRTMKAMGLSRATLIWIRH